MLGHLHGECCVSLHKWLVLVALWNPWRFYMTPKWPKPHSTVHFPQSSIHKYSCNLRLLTLPKLSWFPQRPQSILVSGTWTCLQINSYIDMHLRHKKWTNINNGQMVAGWPRSHRYLLLHVAVSPNGKCGVSFSGYHPWLLSIILIRLDCPGQCLLSALPLLPWSISPHKYWLTVLLFKLSFGACTFHLIRVLTGQL